MVFYKKVLGDIYLLLLKIILSWRQERSLGESTVAVCGSFQSFLGGVPLVQRATGDNGLWRTSVVNNLYQCPALHLVGKFLAYECQTAIPPSFLIPISTLPIP